MTPLMPDLSAPATGLCMPHGTKQGVDAEISNDNSQATFP